MKKLYMIAENILSLSERDVRSNIYRAITKLSAKAYVEVLLFCKLNQLIIGDNIKYYFEMYKEKDAYNINYNKLRLDSEAYLIDQDSDKFLKLKYTASSQICVEILVNYFSYLERNSREYVLEIIYLYIISVLKYLMYDDGLDYTNLEAISKFVESDKILIHIEYIYSLFSGEMEYGNYDDYIRNISHSNTIYIGLR